MPRQPIEIKDINLGGIADSNYQGIANSVAAIVGIDIHSEPGVFKCNQALKKDSGAFVDGEVSKILPCSDGNTYFFGKTSGKIWRRDNAGTWTLQATAAPAAGAVGILDAEEFDGYIYYAMQSRLGRCAVGAAWSTRNDSFATFTNTDAAYHPMAVKNLILYIGDKNYIAQVEGGVFSANALDLEAQYRISSLGTKGFDLVVGTFVNDNVTNCMVFVWNGWAQSWSTEDELYEVGITSFLPADNMTIAAAGTKGNIYAFDGAEMKHMKRIPGDWSGTNKATIALNAGVIFQNRPMFGVSNSSGNPCLQGVYSIGGYSSNFPNVLALEYIISTGNTSGVTIGAMAVVGDLLFVSWKDTTGGTTYGVDVIDTANKATNCYIDTRIMTMERQLLKKISVSVPYKSLPALTSIAISTSVNHGAFSANTSVTDTDRQMQDMTIEDMVEAITFQARVTLTPSVNLTPSIESIIINY